MRTAVTMNPANTSRPSYWMSIVAILCLTGVALAANALHGRGSFEGETTFTPLGDGLVELSINVQGRVTHLGKSTVRIHTLADFSGPVPTPIPPSTGVITAANGDTISFTLKWTVEEVSPGVFDTNGPFTITSGTGRFHDATGGGDYRGIVDIISGETTAEITGELTR